MKTNRPDYDRIRKQSYNYRPSAREQAARIQMRKRRRRNTVIKVVVISLCALLFVSFSLFTFWYVQNRVKTTGDNEAKVESSSATTPTYKTDEQLPTQQQNKDSDTLTFNLPEIEYNGETGYYADNTMMYILGDKVVNLFYSSEAASRYYAETISEHKRLLGDDVTVYNMVVPTHPEFAIPRSLIESGAVSTSSQAENIKYIYQNYSADVIPINCYNALSEHCDEYIYFNTDHHWTGLGGYYAYTAFAQQTEQTPISLSECTENIIPDFEGTLLKYAPSTPLDTVYFYTFPYENYAQRKQTSVNDEFTKTTIYYEDEPSGENSYGVFTWGDNALFIEHNTELNSGKKIAVIKDSFGNAFVPYLSANYDEVHVIDPRYFDMSLSDYCNENEITEVLFVNNVTFCNTASLTDHIKTIF